MLAQITPDDHLPQIAPAWASVALVARPHTVHVTGTIADKALQAKTAFHVAGSWTEELSLTLTLALNLRFTTRFIVGTFSLRISSQERLFRT